MSRRKQFAIWYVIFCSPNLITHAYKTKRAAKNAVRDLRKDFPDYAWSMKRLIDSNAPQAPEEKIRWCNLPTSRNRCNPHSTASARN